ncbi:MAG: hypothetical protein ABI488_23625 [Polyangiaceae bacterium]
MTKKKTTAKPPAGKWLYRGEVPKQPAFRARAERLNEVLVQLRSLTEFDLLDVLLQELDWRRLDVHGNPTNPPGLDLATFAAVEALVADPAKQAKHEAAVDRVGSSAEKGAQARSKALVARIAAVGRGVPLGKDSPAAVIREIDELVEAMASTDYSATERATMIAKTLSQRLNRSIAVSGVEKALQARSRNGRVELIVMECGIEKRSRRDAADRVKAALKK